MVGFWDGVDSSGGRMMRGRNEGLDKTMYGKLFSCSFRL